MKKNSIVFMSILLGIFVLGFISGIPTLPVQAIPPTVAPLPTSGAKYPVADDFNSAIVVVPPYASETFNGIPTKASDDPSACATYSDSIWYKYTATSNIPMTVNTAYSSYDTVVAVYTGTRGHLAMVACNDDQASVLDRTSWVDFNTISGTTYYIMIGQYGVASPSTTLNNFIDVIISTVANDEFYAGKWLSDFPYTNSTGPFSNSQNIYGSTVSSGEINSSCPAVQPYFSNSVWYRVAFPGGYNVTISTAGSSYDTVLDLYSDLNSPPFLSPVACNDDFGGALQSQLTFTPVSANRYYIRVSHYFVNPVTTAQTLKLTVTMAVASTSQAVKSSSSLPAISQSAQTPTFMPPTPQQ